MKSIFLLSLLILSFSSSAVTWKDSSYAEVTTLYPVDSGMAFYTNHSDTSVSSCDNGRRFIILEADSNYNAKVGALMAAFAAGKKVKLRYDADQPKTCAAKVNRFLVQK